MNFVSLFISRIIAGLVATLAGWLSTKWGIILDAESQAQLAANTTTQLLIVFSIFYPIIHKWISSKINPGDAASTRLGSKEKAQTEVLRHNG